MDTFGLQIEEGVKRTVAYLQTKKHPLFLTTSNRWSGEKGGEMPKSTQLAHAIAKQSSSAQIIDIPSLNIFPCEGNVSTKRGNSCGTKDAALNDAEKNPSGCHRCWASINNPTDELWKVSKALLASDVVIFFGSVRWGQMNSFYQKLIERLTWLENRHTTLGEENLLANIDAGIIAMGHNWNTSQVIVTQKRVLEYFGFHVVDDLSWSAQFTKPEDESNTSYVDAAHAFNDTLAQL
jgi:multimeric flavodoxin WrbA